jgi:vacuolar protein sorting-associated protein 13A/C
VFELPAKTTTDYAWDYPIAENKRIRFMLDGVPLPRPVDMMAIGIQPPMKVPVCV